MALICNNATVVAYVNKQRGTVSRSLSLLTKELLSWVKANTVTLSARYLPGKPNVLANQLSHRGQVIGIEWSLHPEVPKMFHLLGHLGVQRPLCSYHLAPTA